MNLEKFSPNNLHSLDAEGVNELQNLTIEQIGELAEKYNTPNNYLAVINTANKGNAVVTPATYKSIISAKEKGFTKLKIVDTLANYKANASYEVSIQEPKEAVIDLGKIEPLVQKSIDAEPKEFKTEMEVLIEEAENDLTKAIEAKKSKKVIAELKQKVQDLHEQNTQK